MKDKVVIITGGSSGIGKALAFEFGMNGSRIVITGRRANELDQAKAALEQAGIETMAIQGDVSKAADNERMAREAITRFGRIDVLINNAGMSMRALFSEAEPGVIQKLMEINFMGTVYATKYCLPEIIKHKGSVIGISSIAGYRGLPARTGYSASKFALNGFLESLRTELLYSGVHVLTACPGFTASNIRKHAFGSDGTAQGESPRNEQKMMSAETCAAYIYKATVKRRRTLILTGQGKLAVFLNKWLPSFTDKLVYKSFAAESGSPLK